jgi:hypothetical protein
MNIKGLLGPEDVEVLVGDLISNVQFYRVLIESCVKRADFSIRWLHKNWWDVGLPKCIKCSCECLMFAALRPDRTCDVFLG